jgi:hypothetical protein
MREKKPFQMGRGPIPYDDEPDIVRTDEPELNDRKPDRRGGMGKKMEEGEEPGAVEAQTDEETKNAAYEKFANLIKKVVSAKLMQKKVKFNLQGNKQVVAQVLKMIEMETKYLDAVITGQAADTPALQKDKALIDSEAKLLDRMMNTVDFWPFK